MDVCKRLGERYIWVDRLCIVQDDKKDKYGQIRSLEAIYSRANIVIVAACGDNIHSGLTGIHDGFPRGNHQIPTDVFGFTMANKFHGFEKATSSTWNERGWTYQEAVLARRKLYFTPAEIWFECAEGIQRENAFSTHRASEKPVGNRLRFHSHREGESSSTSDNYEDYRRHLENYSRRILTYPSDVYHAFHGIEDAFYPNGGIMFGLPESDFSRALLWYPYDWPDLQERRFSDEEVMLPSWSWASLIGHIATCRLYGHRNSKALQRGSFYCSLCEWTTWNGDSSQQSARRINSMNDDKVWTQLDDTWSEQDPTDEYQSDFDSFKGAPDYRQFLALAWAKGCIEADVPVDLLVSPAGSAMSTEDLASRWPTVGAFWAEVRSRTCHKQDPSSPPNLHPGDLLTRTQWSVLRVEHDGYTEHLRGDIYVPNTHFIIRHTQGGETVGSLLGTVEYRLRGTATPDRAADVDFIALAVGCMPVCVSGSLDKESLMKNRFHRDRPEDLLEFAQPGVLVMAVRWDGPIARRVALGWVTLQGWVDSKPDFRTVILA